MITQEKINGIKTKTNTHPNPFDDFLISASFSTSQEPPLPVHFLSTSPTTYAKNQKHARSTAYSHIPTCLHSNPQMPAPEHGDLRPRGASVRVCRGAVAPTLRLGFPGGEVHVASSLRRIQPCSLYPRDGEHMGFESRTETVPLTFTRAERRRGK